VARYNLIEGSVHPYVFFGTGVAINTTSVSPSAGVKYSSSETDFLMAPGIGILVRVADGAGLFIQTRIDLDFIPMGGMIPSDSPAIFVPVQAGLSFFVL